MSAARSPSLAVLPALLTQLGDDPFGHKIADELAACGIDTAHIAFTDKANTALAFVSWKPTATALSASTASRRRTYSTRRNRWTPPRLTPAAFALHFAA